MFLFNPQITLTYEKGLFHNTVENYAQPYDSVACRAIPSSSNLK